MGKYSLLKFYFLPMWKEEGWRAALKCCTVRSLFSLWCTQQIRHTGYTCRWDGSLFFFCFSFIDTKSSAAQASGDEWALGSACLCASSLRCICDAGTDRGFLYASFTLKTHHNSVLFRSFRRLYETLWIISLPGFFSYDSHSPLPKFWWMMTAPVCGCNCCKTLSKARSTPGVFILLQQVKFLILTPVCEGFPPRENISNTANDTDDLLSLLLSSTTLNHRNTINFKPIVAASLRTGALHPWSQNN